MATDVLTGEDTVVLFDRVFNDFGSGDVVSITFPNELASSMTGKNGNSVIAENQSGNNADVEIKVLLGSSDDQFLQGKLTTAQADFSSQTLGTGEFVKRVGDGLGNISRIVYELEGGYFRNKVDGRDNADGDTEQAYALYRMKFTRVKRSIQ